MVDFPRPDPSLSDSPPADPLEARLRSEALWREPPDLAARVMLGLPSRRAGLDRRALLRFAAAVLAAFGVWFFATGAAPTVASAAPSPMLERVVADTRAVLPASLDRHLGPWTQASAEASSLPATLIALLGVVLIVVGLWLARQLLADPEERRTP